MSDGTRPMISFYLIPSEAHRGLLAPGPAGEHVAVHTRIGSISDLIRDYPEAHVEHDSSGGTFPQWNCWLDRRKDCGAFAESEAFAWAGLVAKMSHPSLALYHDGQRCPLAISRLRDDVARASGATEEEIAAGMQFVRNAIHDHWIMPIGIRDGKLRYAAFGATSDPRHFVHYVLPYEIKIIPTLVSLPDCPPIERGDRALAIVAESLGLGTLVRGSEVDGGLA